MKKTITIFFILSVSLLSNAQDNIDLNLNMGIGLSYKIIKNSKTVSQ